MVKKFSLLLGLTLLGASFSAHAAETSVARRAITTYEQGVYQNYKAAYEGSVALKKAIDTFLAKPTEENLAAARKSWTQTRHPYALTEAYRFYEGPIDGVDPRNGKAGIEDGINGWPLNEAYLDYVKGNAKAGLVNDTATPITEEYLRKRNMKDDEKDITIGWHAIEFLLWGQPAGKEGSGNRPASDYANDKNDTLKQRRRSYLSLLSTMLVQDLQYLTNQWEPGKNYAATFDKLEDKKALGNILTGIATLSGFEVASERLGNPMDSNARQDQQNCFSNTTKQEFVGNFKGVMDVYEGNYNGVKGTGISAVVAEKNPELDKKIQAKLAETKTLVDGINDPFINALTTPKDSAERQHIEKTITSLVELSKLFKEAGKALGTDVVIKKD